MDDVVLMGDLRVAAVPVEESGDPLVEAASGFWVSGLKAADDPHRSRVRSGLRDRLVAAGAALPAGLHLLWVEGFRLPAVQAGYFEGYRAQVAADDPTRSEDETYRLASRYVSPPAVAPHVSGAAIDLSLCDDDGTELDLGTPVNASPEESGGACYFAATVPGVARELRTVLATALEGAGLVNYPTEWWHWSYGDRYWALTTGAPAALYGPVASEG